MTRQSLWPSLGESNQNSYISPLLACTMYEALHVLSLKQVVNHVKLRGLLLKARYGTLQM